MKTSSGGGDLMDAHTHTNSDESANIVVSATKEEWRNVIDKLKFIPDHAVRDDSFSDLVYWLINQGVYE